MAAEAPTFMCVLQPTRGFRKPPLPLAPTCSELFRGPLRGEQRGLRVPASHRWPETGISAFIFHFYPLVSFLRL